MEENKQKRSLKFKIGLILLILNFPIGYIGIGVSAGLAVKTGNNLWIYIGGGLYGLSWIMLGLGILFAGYEGIKIAKNIWKKIFSIRK